MALNAAPPVMTMITNAMISEKVTAAGLDDAQVFEAVHFADVLDMISALFAGTRCRTSF